MDRLDELIYSAYAHCKNEIGYLLQELQQRRQSDLRPATKFLKNEIEDQYFHMERELEEISNEIWNCGEVNEKHLAMEVIDLQTSCQTFLEDAMGLSKDKIIEYRKMVIEKNEAKGHYKDGVADED